VEGDRPAGEHDQPERGVGGVEAVCVRSEAAALRLVDEPADQDRDVLEGEAGLEDRAERFLERVGTPYFPTGGAQASERLSLLVVEPVGCLEQRPEASLNRRAASGSSTSRSLFQ
jgi:hypothetical protein